MVTKGERGRGGVNEESGSNRHTLLMSGNPLADVLLCGDDFSLSQVLRVCLL